MIIDVTKWIDESFDIYWNCIQSWSFERFPWNLLSASTPPKKSSAKEPKRLSCLKLELKILTVIVKFKFCWLTKDFIIMDHLRLLMFINRDIAVQIKNHIKFHLRLNVKHFVNLLFKRFCHLHCSRLKFSRKLNP